MSFKTKDPLTELHYCLSLPFPWVLHCFSLFIHLSFAFSSSLPLSGSIKNLVSRPQQGVYSETPLLCYLLSQLTFQIKSYSLPQCLSSWLIGLLYGDRGELNYDTFSYKGVFENLEKNSLEDAWKEYSTSLLKNLPEYKLGFKVKIVLDHQE